ncbi:MULTISPECIES: hypothetical protein [unclassified Wolbachia]|nr:MULTISPECIES: hypothetical protein [unclassified Wolbachia]
MTAVLRHTAAVSQPLTKRDDELLNYHNKGAGRVCQVSFFVSTE